MSKVTKADIILLIVAIIWGGGFVAGKMALTGADPFVILAWRFLVSAVICGIVFWKRVAATPKKVIVYGVGIGVLQALALSVQLVGLEYTTSAKQSFLCTAYVAMTPFVSWLIVKKKPGINAVLGGILALVGIGLISLESVFGFLFSVLYYQEPLTWRLLVGGVLCFTAILLNTVERKLKRMRKDPCW